MVQDAARDQNVDARLVNAIAQAESGGDQSAVSPVGAIGVMQLMPDTAAGLGVNPYDKKQNIEGGAKYLREMLDTFGGDVKKAVAAYNAGPAAVKAYGGVPPYPETQAYVDRVLDLYR
jgi:soluble lytic murein transglycosylase-like protein